MNFFFWLVLLNATEATAAAVGTDREGGGAFIVSNCASDGQQLIK